ncbi:MAG TPA: MoaD/ThiS family protein [Gammaproteobacteria bacterium]|nr:MoaD/ThiS family protein [Gammaproteobacteria bacterium]
MAQEYLPFVACAVGDEIVVRNYPLQEGDTLVLLPPVSGG